MITNTDTELIGQAGIEAKRMKDLEAAIRFALSEILPNYRQGVVHVWLSFNFLKRPSFRITPQIKIDTHTDVGDCYDPDTVKLDLHDCLRQVEERFNREHVTWGELRIDTKKQKVYR